MEVDVLELSIGKHFFERRYDWIGGMAFGVFFVRDDINTFPLLMLNRSQVVLQWRL